MDEKDMEELEKRLKNQKADRNYNFFRPVGQFIEHVDTINFSMDKDGNFHFENIGQVNEIRDESIPATPQTQVEVRNDDEWIVECIKKLNEEKVLKRLFDYTWVMEVMNQTKGLPKFNTPSSFISYLNAHDIKRLPSEDTINKKQNKFTGTFPNWVFTDCDTTEAYRRINVGKRFLTLLRNV